MKAFRYTSIFVALMCLSACSLLNMQDRAPQDQAEQVYCDWQAQGGTVAHTYELTVFSDYECSACQQAGRVIQTFKKEHPQNFKLSIVHYPLDISCNSAMLRPMHANACKAAQYVLCAGAQDLEAYWKVHFAFVNLSNFAPSSLNRALNSLGLNEAAISHCVYTGQAKARLAADIKKGLELGIDSTPSIFINGIRIPALRPAMLERFLQLLVDGTKIACEKPV